MRRDPRGSRWRKWDLHLHSPGTTLSNGYLIDGQPDWDSYCDFIEQSDVAAFGITDYFKLRSFFECTSEHARRYANSEKVFFPNLELRLNESVNRDGQSINIHLVFRDDLDPDVARRFEEALLTERTFSDGRKKACSDLSSRQDYESATVTRDSIREAIGRVFGTKADVWSNVLILPSVKGDGIRPGGSGRQRKAAIADEIDKISHAFFGNSSSRSHFLDSDRLEDGEGKIAPKPVFGCCDAHSFDDLRTRLGRHHAGDGTSAEITWVKADVTFEGLQQTLIEPDDRVAIQPIQPDHKEPYKYISRVTFADADIFPSEAFFNPNLTSVIGSRSSGKSALLAHIAYAVDPGHTVDQQLSASGKKRQDLGPAAGLTWAEAATAGCSVEWGNAEANSGKVVYIPQNSLFAVSERPDVVTEKIEPVLSRNYPDFGVTLRAARREIADENEEIRKAVETWFELRATSAFLQSEAEAVGDRDAIEATLSQLDRSIAETKDRSALSEQELETYQGLLHKLDQGDTRLAELSEDARDLQDFVIATPEGVYQANLSRYNVEISIRPDASQLPEALAERFSALIDEARSSLLTNIANATATYRDSVESERIALANQLEQERGANADLIEKNKAEVELEDLVQKRQTQQRALDRLDVAVARKAHIDEETSKVGSDVERRVNARKGMLDALASTFSEVDRALDGLTFHLEVDFPEETLQVLSSGYRKTQNSTYIDRESGLLQVQRVHARPQHYLEYMQLGRQGVNQRYEPSALAIQALTATPEIRFAASLDGDRIGGFNRSSMTPGKQALFALTLILNETEEGWPLLIDQPEDDLDSRSIYDVIVPYLVSRKKERQIIMVTHNANLVVGADSEEVLVTNRHGYDSPNRDGRTFAYLSGPLEHSGVNDSRYTLRKCGIRQHSCEILDGGIEAFRKRQEKYNISTVRD